MNAVAKNLKRLRKQAGVTQEALAERLHVTRQAVSNWETARTQPDIETLKALAEALGTDVNGLICGPRPAVDSYARYQKKYVICAAACAALVLAERLLQWKLVPWLQTHKAAHYLVWPSFLYGMTVQLLAALAAGALLPAAISLWRDIRIRVRLCRRGFLMAGLLPLALLLLAAAVLFPSMIGAGMPELRYPICQYIRDLVLYTVKNRAELAFFAGLCLFLGLNR
ncbi:helix-turn-helix domain-containing protein [uncultured Dysosmobacter sp.]|uniref:helix-turn-helix domain-containing protein n=1 Tax=uncultured Dysosmobacter sp. TaxID=2591384 RepID=UPI0026080726|nr:helix-turn-helix transcriptional regulator [uncultured Dysosmobacter sp.]